MIRLNVFVRVNESNREEAIKAAKELTACSLKEEGCIAYDTFVSSTRPDVFMICETWQNFCQRHYYTRSNAGLSRQTCQKNSKIVA